MPLQTFLGLDEYAREHPELKEIVIGELLVEKSDLVATNTLNRPDRLNATSGPMLSALSEALVDADKDPEVRVVVLTGAGRRFSGG